MLGELRNVGNVDTPTSSHDTGHKHKGKETVRSSDKPRVGEEKQKRVTLPDEPPRARIVSAPSPAKRPRVSVARSSSGPPTAMQDRLHPSTSASSRVSPAPIIEEEEESAQVQSAEGRLHLDWALRPSSRTSYLEEVRGEDFAMEEMRREIGHLQLDMLRMGRGLKVCLSSANSCDATVVLQC